MKKTYMCLGGLLHGQLKTVDLDKEIVIVEEWLIPKCGWMTSERPKIPDHVTKYKQYEVFPGDERNFLVPDDMSDEEAYDLRCGVL